MAKAKTSIKSAVLTSIVSILAILLIPGFFFSIDWIKAGVAYDKIYSEGSRSGQVIKIAEKGMIWKTTEVTLGLTQSGAYIGQWDFSVDTEDPNRDKIISELQTAYQSGSLVNVQYIQRYGVKPWRGKTEYFPVSVTIIPNQYEEFLKEMEKQNESYMQEMQGQRFNQ